MIKITDDLLGTTFEDNFLTNVAYEVRFAPNLSLKPNIKKFQSLIRKDYPNYNEIYPIPFGLQSKKNESNLLNFSFENKQEGLEIYFNKYSIFGLRTSQYKGFNTFSKRFLEIIKKFIDSCNIDSFIRIGMRYINTIPFNNDKAKSNNSKRRYFNPILAKEISIKDFSNQYIDLRFNEDQYEIHQQFVFQRDNSGKFIVIIDIDNSIKDNINIDKDLVNIENIINDLHKYIKIYFYKLVTIEFLKVLKKEDELDG